MSVGALPVLQSDPVLECITILTPIHGPNMTGKRFEACNSELKIMLILNVFT